MTRSMMRLLASRQHQRCTTPWPPSPSGCSFPAASREAWMGSHWPCCSGGAPLVTSGPLKAHLMNLEASSV